MKTDKLILDACCGGRMFWFNRQHPDALYVDIRKEERPISYRPEFSVNPDMIADFRNLPFEDKTFKLVVFDPPHLKTLGETSYMAKKYGKLQSETWHADLGQGFKECWRVLDDYGTLIFKWNEHEITLANVLSLFPVEPLFGHPTAKHGKTKWCVFLKIPTTDEDKSSGAKALRTPPTPEDVGICAGDLL